MEEELRTSVFCIAFCASLLLSGPASSFGDADYGGGCCGFPAELRADIEALRESFSRSELQQLLDQQFIGGLCQNHECGQLSEDQASRFLDRERIATERQDESRQNRINLWIALSGALFAGGSMLVSVMALRQAGRNERDIGRLEDRVAMETSNERN